MNKIMSTDRGQTDGHGETNTTIAGGIMIRIKVTDLVAVLSRKDTPL